MAKINNKITSLHQIISSSCELQLLDKSSQKSKEAADFSMGMLLGSALCTNYPQQFYPVSMMTKGTQKTCVSDFLLRREGAKADQDIEELCNTAIHLGEHEMQALNSTIQGIISANVKIEALEISRSVALKMFAQNPFMLETINTQWKQNDSFTAYKIIDYLDLSPHALVPSTRYLKSFEILAQSAKEWQPSSGNFQPITRIESKGFLSESEKESHQQAVTSAKNRDHRTIGAQQELFFHHSSSPGSPFMLPHGTRILNRLLDFMRLEYSKRGYLEVQTPMIFRKELWETSGHWENYNSDMYVIDDQRVQSERYGLKPMNCPGHCLIFANKLRSYRDLPLRLADFSSLHR